MAIVERSRLLQLTAMCMVLVFLACTQDIAVDAWAISLLSRKNVGTSMPIELLVQRLNECQSNKFRIKPVGPESDKRTTGGKHLRSYLHFSVFCANCTVQYSKRGHIH